jgi:stage III sporulation protein AA
MLDNLIPVNMYNLISSQCKIDSITEIRIRAGQPLRVHNGLKYVYIYMANGTDFYIIDNTDIEYILSKATKHSLYAVNDVLIEGYISYNGGIRIGVCGQGVKEDNKLITIKNINYLNIRIPKEVNSIADKLKFNYKKPPNCLIISPPGMGKTTMLRELCRRISNNGNNCLLIDERNEVSASENGIASLNVGKNTDVISGVPKIVAYENVIRSMRPDVIFTDEIYNEKEVNAIIEAIRCGVKVIATIHSESRFDILNSSIYKKLFEHIDYCIELTDQPYLGTIKFEGQVSL